MICHTIKIIEDDIMTPLKLGILLPVPMNKDASANPLSGLTPGTSLHAVHGTMYQPFDGYCHIYRTPSKKEQKTGQRKNKKEQRTKDTFKPLKG